MTIQIQLLALLCLCLTSLPDTAFAWAPTSSTFAQRRGSAFTKPWYVRQRALNPRCRPASTTRLHGIFDFLTNPYDSKIPPELSEEIYRAEANTEAAKDRGTRIALYTLLAILGIAVAFFNGFLTEIRINGLPDPDGGTTANVDVLSSLNPLGNPSGSNNMDILQQAGFGWVLSNPLYKFLFTNKIGGALCLLLGGGSALLAEAEFDSKRINAEKIYEELERRRAQKTASSSSTRRAKQSGKQKKSLKALSEVLVAQEKEPTATQEDASIQVEPEPSSDAVDDKGGIFGKVIDLYEKADSMAASQALLLNKKLEEAGVVEKITDETGLKVIGKEEAAKRKQQEQEADKQK